MTTMFWIWMAAGVVFLILELVTPMLFFVSFAIGAVASGIYSQFYPESFYWQIGVFLIVSLLLLPLTRKFAKRISHEQPEHANVDRMIGKIGVVTKPISPGNPGQIKFEGEVWLASANSAIEESASVRIVSLAGTRVNVEKIS